MWIKFSNNGILQKRGFSIGMPYISLFSRVGKHYELLKKKLRS